MSARARLLGSVGLGEAKDIAQRRDDRLKVELRRLRQVRLVAEVVQVEESRTSFDLGLDDGRRGDLEVAAAEEVVAEALHHDRPQLQHLGYK